MEKGSTEQGEGARVGRVAKEKKEEKKRGGDLQVRRAGQGGSRRQLPSGRGGPGRERRGWG
jgi:hypothetical protein